MSETANWKCSSDPTDYIQTGTDIFGEPSDNTSAALLARMRAARKSEIATRAGWAYGIMSNFDARSRAMYVDLTGSAPESIGDMHRIAVNLFELLSAAEKAADYIDVAAE